jgi:hypothetical protein
MCQVNYFINNNGEYFDTRNSPPEIQVNEKLYYQPCAICGRKSHDPECHCASLIR